MRKKLIAVLTMGIFLLSASLAMAAVPAIFINGNQLASDNPAVVEEGRTLLPMRAVFEALGQQVDWNAEDKSITSGDIWMQIDNPVAMVNGAEYTLDVPARLIEGVTYVPLRFVAETLGKDVNWDGSQNRVDINDRPVVDEEATDEVVDEEVTGEEEAVDENATGDENTEAGTVDEEAGDEQAAGEEAAGEEADEATTGEENVENEETVEE